jgi:hypothetical protein
MGVKYDVVAVTGTYQDPETGQKKNKYVTCGRVIENDNGFSLKLDVVPISGEGWFNLWEPKKKNNGESFKRNNNYTSTKLDDEPPF